MAVDLQAIIGTREDPTAGKQETGQLADQGALRGQLRLRGPPVASTAARSNRQFTVCNEEGEIRIRSRNDCDQQIGAGLLHNRDGLPSVHTRRLRSRRDQLRFS